MPFRHVHLFDAAKAPRAQLPYVEDDGEAIGDSEVIIAHVARKYAVTLDAALTPAQRDQWLLVVRLLDDLYWVMSYSRWKDEAFWPQFAAALKAQHPQLTDADLLAAKEFNAKRYHYQGIGRYDPPGAYARGLADLEVLARLVPEEGFIFGPEPSSVDAAVYGFIANIHYSPIATPLKAFVTAQANLVRHCDAIHGAVGGA